jgi:hypothetical protein
MEDDYKEEKQLLQAATTNGPSEKKEGEDDDTKRKVCCCIACINWVRRLSPPLPPSPASDMFHARSRKNSNKKIPIPIDNLLLFMMCPGAAIMKPDQRSLHRMMSSIANKIAVTMCCPPESQQGEGGGGGTKMHTVHNIYLRFCTPLMDRCIQMFRDKYMVLRSSSSMDEQQLPPPSPVAFELYSCTTTPHHPASSSSSNSSTLVDDMVRVWWESNGMPLMLTDRATARYCLLMNLCIFVIPSNDTQNQQVRSQKPATRLHQQPATKRRQ